LVVSDLLNTLLSYSDFLTVEIPTNLKFYFTSIAGECSSSHKELKVLLRVNCFSHWRISKIYLCWAIY